MLGNLTVRNWESKSQALVITENFGSIKMYCPEGMYSKGKCIYDSCTVCKTRNFSVHGIWGSLFLERDFSHALFSQAGGALVVPCGSGWWG